MLHTFFNWRRVHPKNNRVKQWLLEDDYSRLSVASEKKMTTTAATKITGKQAIGLMDAMDVDVDEEFGADVAGDFSDYQKMLEDSHCVLYVAMFQLCA